MRFYIVDDQYIRYLKTVDPKVPDNYNATKPFIGIVLDINGFKYLAPLTSYKQNQENIKSSTPTCVKMHEQGKPTNKLGMIQLNNMIPVLDSVITEFDMNSRDQKYQNLLNNQLVYIKTVREEIEKKSAKLYRLVEKQVPFYVGMSCDFTALEKASAVYVAAAVAAFTAPAVAAPATPPPPATPEN
jgi:protein AbiQ